MPTLCCPAEKVVAKDGKKHKKYVDRLAEGVKKEAYDKEPQIFLPPREEEISHQRHGKEKI